MVYNGHKRVHLLKFQSLTVPSGLIANLFGPVGKFFERKLNLITVFNNFGLDKKREKRKNEGNEAKEIL